MKKQMILDLTARMAKKRERCDGLFSVKLKKSEKFAFQAGLKGPEIRTLLYLKAVQEDTQPVTSVEHAAQDLGLARESVFAALTHLRLSGFIQTQLVP